MKKILLTLAVFMVTGLFAVAQDRVEVSIDTNEVHIDMINPAQPVQETEQEIKERQKRLREYTDEVAYAKASNSMRRGYFVLLADDIQIGPTGYRHYDISQNSNFVLVQADDGIIQFALNTGLPGTNGLGGWTGKGTVRNKHIKFLDNGDVVMDYQLIGSTVNATVFITLFNNSKRAMAQITGGPSITVYGEILPYRDKAHR